MIDTIDLDFLVDRQTGHGLRMHSICVKQGAIHQLHQPNLEFPSCPAGTNFLFAWLWLQNACCSMGDQVRLCKVMLKSHYCIAELPGALGRAGRHPAVHTHWLRCVACIDIKPEHSCRLHLCACFLHALAVVPVVEARSVPTCSFVCHHQCKAPAYLLTHL